MNEFPDIKLIATDLDDTLLGPGQALSEENKNALLRCIANGIHVVAATGRAESAVPKEILSIAEIRYLICSNGARIIDRDAGEVLFAKYIDEAAVDHIIPLLHDPEILTEVFWNGDPYAEADRIADPKRYGVPDSFLDYFISSRLATQGLAAFAMAHRTEIEKFHFTFPGPAQKDRIWRHLQKAGKLYEITSSLGFNLEVDGLGVNKAAGVKFIADRLGIGQKETMCIGDNANDISMIAYAGIGVAVENAVADAKAAADYITKRNDENGVARAIERFVLNGPR
ncbi:MAG: Cof-type HAD-IIB family hydrolase [Clostridiales Family XIII bacterium]|jgi:Cof subfamily protein (haloacid dehalogenase superfamily)|nr:Cof-type HAD-IIB family hydrolase [Clostridiales Family XIII bacterium]